MSQMSQMSMFDSPKPPEPQPPRQLPGCSLIYQPKGRAREYAALACNIYAGCDHGCVYCYAPSATRKTREQFDASSLRPGNFLAKMEREAAKYQAAGIRARVLLSFTCDPYQHLDKRHQITRWAIQILHRHGLAVEVLTKGGSRALRDLDLFGPEDAFATTMTLLDEARSLSWEPCAALPQDRIDTIHAFHQAGIPTWVSLEPVIDPAASLAIIRETSAIVDVFKVGTLNYSSKLPTHLRREVAGIDWRLFGLEASAQLSRLGYRRNRDPDTLIAGDFYVKRDLARYID